MAGRSAPWGAFFDGDSLNGNPFGSTTYPDLLMADRPSGITTLTNVNIGGYTWSQLANGSPTGSFPASQRLTQFCKMADLVFYLMVGGINGYALGQTGAGVYAAEKVCADLVHSVNPDAIVIGSTTLPATGVTGSNETKRTDGNTLVLDNADGAFDVVVDLAANADLSDPSNTTYYIDGIHPTVAGLTIMADLMGAAVDTVLAANGLVP